MEFAMALMLSPLMVLHFLEKINEDHVNLF